MPKPPVWSDARFCAKMQKYEILSSQETQYRIMKRDCYLHSVHMAKAPTLQASPGLLQRSDGSPSHNGSDSDRVCDASASTRQTDTFNQPCQRHSSLGEQQQEAHEIALNPVAE